MDGKVEPPPEGLLVVIASDVTTSTKAALSWKRPKPAEGAQPRRGHDPVVGKPLTISELYWANPGAQAW